MSLDAALGESLHTVLNGAVTDASRADDGAPDAVFESDAAIKSDADIEGASQDASTAAFHAFLRAKQSVDDRALHQGVYGALLDWLAQPRQMPLEVLEIGCGIGAMIRRLERWRTWEVSPVPVRYTALDRDPANIALLPPPHSDRCAVLPVVDDFYPFAADAIAQGRRYDLVIAHAVLDLLHLPRALPLLHQLIRPNGAGWFTLNFDGATILEPAINPPFDDLVEARYHATMDARVTDGAPSGDSRTGRHLFAAFPAAGLQIVAAGPSDWVVRTQDGAYPAEEQQFVHSILETMRGALAGDAQIEPQRFEQWLARRHEQLAGGALTYLAKQYDFLVRPQ